MRILKYALGFILLAALLLFAYLLWWSPGEAQPLVDTAGNPMSNSISEIEKLEVNGNEQYLIIRGQDKSKPVLLFLHGGPGFPALPYLRDLDLVLEKHFVVVYWEQRAAGKSFSEEVPTKTMTIDQFVDDAAAVSQHLLQRFNLQKMHLMGHSWGAFLGLLTAHKHPQYFNSYTGIGQACSQYEAEKLSLNWVKEKAKEGYPEDLTNLENLKLPAADEEGDVWFDYILEQRDWVHKYGGGFSRQEINVFWMAVKDILYSPEYTIFEKLSIQGGNTLAIKHLWPQLMRRDLAKEIDSLQVPIYVFQGKHDYQTPAAMVQNLFKTMKAPHKELILFEQSAHAPFLDETEKFNRELDRLFGNL